MLKRRGVARRILAHVRIVRRALAAGAAWLRGLRAPPPGPSAPDATDAGTAAQEPVADVGTLVRMLDDAIELARRPPEAERREPVDVHDAIASVLAWHEPERAKLWEAPRPLLVLASAPALEQLFEILIENALASAARVIVRLDHGTSALVVHVDDDGPGVPRSERAHLFEPFAALVAAGPHTRLAAAQRIAKAHGGEITVSSSPEGGARFTVLLPRILDHELELATAS